MIIFLCKVGHLRKINLKSSSHHI